MSGEKFKTVQQLNSEMHISNKSLVDFKKDWVIVIYECDLADSSNSVIGVADNRGSAMRIIQEYYGEDAKISNPRIIEDSGLNFDVSVIVDDSMWGGNYRVTGMDFQINKHFSLVNTITKKHINLVNSPNTIKVTKRNKNPFKS